MYVIKRNGNHEQVNFNKITIRIRTLKEKLNLKYCDAILISQKVIEGFKSGMKTEQLDILSAEICVQMSIKHYQYNQLAGAILVSNLQKKTSDSILETTKKLYNNSTITGSAPLVHVNTLDIVQKYEKDLQSCIDYSRDFLYDFVGFKFIESNFLLKVWENGEEVIERPQHWLLRVAIGIHGDNLFEIIDTYNALSTRQYCYSKALLKNSGTFFPQLSSDFLLPIMSDSISGIYSSLNECSEITLSGGSIGLAVQKIRGGGSYVAGTNGYSNGIGPMLRVYNSSSKYLDGNSSSSSYTVYFEPWHIDIYTFLDLKKNNGKEENRARFLNYALWIPNLFMKRVENTQHWSLFCPNDAKGLNTHYGEEFDFLYLKYENDNSITRKTVEALEIWNLILKSLVETGMPSIMFKDFCNSKSNQNHLGTIECSSLTCDIIQYSSSDSIASSNSVFINLSNLVNLETQEFNFDHLGVIVKQLVQKLNLIIDIERKYTFVGTRMLDEQNRPLSIGVQGLSDVLVKLRIPFESNEYFELNRKIFEVMYFNALQESCNLAKLNGKPCKAFKDSLISRGMFQFNLWKNVNPDKDLNLQWGLLRQEILLNGVYNILLISVMDSSTTSTMFNTGESCKPFFSNLLFKKILNEIYMIPNQYLVDDLMELDLWTPKIRNLLIKNNGSIQSIHEIPDHIKLIYKTSWEISQKTLLMGSLDRSAFIDHSESHDVWMLEPTAGKLNAYFFYAFRGGAKTSCHRLITHFGSDYNNFISSLEEEEDDNSYLVNLRTEENPLVDLNRSLSYETNDSSIEETNKLNTKIEGEEEEEELKQLDDTKIEGEEEEEEEEYNRNYSLSSRVSNLNAFKLNAFNLGIEIKLPLQEEEDIILKDEEEEDEDGEIMLYKIPSSDIKKSHPKVVSLKRKQEEEEEEI